MWVGSTRPLTPEGDTHGLLELTAAMRTFLEQWENVTATAERVLDAGDNVLCLAVWRARGCGPRAFPWSTLKRTSGPFVDGRAIPLVNPTATPRRALEAAGLSE